MLFKKSLTEISVQFAIFLTASTALFKEIFGLHKKIEVHSVRLLASVHFKCTYLEAFQIKRG